MGLISTLSMAVNGALSSGTGTGPGQDHYLIGPATAEIDNEVSAYIVTTTSAEAEHLELEE